MGIDFRDIWAADFDNAIRFYVRRPARQLRVTRRPPSHQNSKDMTNIYRYGYRFCNNVIRFYVRAPPVGQRTPATRRHTKIQKRWQIYRYGYGYGYRFRGYFGR